MAAEPDSSILDYAKPQPLIPHSFIGAFIFGFPTLLFWIDFICDKFAVTLRLGMIIEDWPMLVSFIAIPAALASFIYYGVCWQRPKPWFVIVSLTLNVALALVLFVNLFTH